MANKSLTMIRQIIAEELQLMKESSLSRVWQHVEGDGSFAVISASRKQFTDDQNKLRYIALKAIVKAKGLGFIELKGGYTETNEAGAKVDVKEDSLLIPNISAKDAIDFGVIFDQDGVLFKRAGQFSEVATSPRKGKNGQIISKFAVHAGAENLDFSSETLEFVYSELKKGSHKGRKYAHSYQGEGNGEESVEQ
jgi:hypothetical protein